MRKGAKAALAGLAGLLLALILLELSLAAVHFMNLRRSAGNSSALPVILCVGNSITKGDGAPPGESYPELLERELAASGRAHRVVNGGVSNATTTLLLDRLSYQLKEIRPKVVALMVGDPNYWFNFGRARFLSRQNQGGAYGRFFASAEKLIYSLRSVNLMRLLISRPRETPPSRTAAQWLGYLTSVSYSGEWVKKPVLVESGSVIDTHLAKSPDDVEYLLASAAIAVRQGDWKKAEERLARARAVAPGRYFLFQDSMLEKIAERAPPSEMVKAAKVRELLLQNRPPQNELEALRKFHFANHSIEDPAFPAGMAPKARCAYIDGLLSYAPLDLARHMVSFRCHNARGNAQRAVEIITAAIERNPHSMHMPRVRRILKEEMARSKALSGLLAGRLREIFARHQPSRDAGRGADIAAWIRADLTEMVQIIRASGAKVILQAYPPLRDQSYRPIDELLPRFAEELGVPLSDTQNGIRALGLGAQDWQANYTDAFGPTDSHLSAKGNLLVARILQRSLDELGWLTP